MNGDEGVDREQNDKMMLQHHLLCEALLSLIGQSECLKWRLL